MLTKKACKFKWSEVEQEAFEGLKSIVTSETVLKNFSTGNTTKIVVDASNVGLRAVLLQEQKDKNFYPVMYASRLMEKASVSQKQATEEELREALDGDMTSSEDGEAEDGDSNYEPG